VGEETHSFSRGSPSGSCSRERIQEEVRSPIKKKEEKRSYWDGGGGFEKKKRGVKEGPPGIKKKD